MRKIIQLFIICTIVVTVGSFQLGCSKLGEEKESKKVSKNKSHNETYYYDLYIAQVEKTNQTIKEYNDLIEKNLGSNSLLQTSGELIVELDKKAKECRLQMKKMRENISQYNQQDLTKKMSDFKILIDKAIEIIAKMERQFSKENINKVVNDANTLIRPEYQAYRKRIYEEQQLALSNLAGLRDIFLGMYNDLIDDANKRLAALNANPLSHDRANVVAAPTTPARTAEPATIDSNPIVTGSTEGGRILGIIRDSQTGRPIARAFVGFKRLRESTDYFYSTHTGEDGSYQSPYLRPGSYYVDIKQEGYVVSQNQSVNVVIGSDTSENVSMTQPIGEGEFRITVSWTSEKKEAVQDVDSYLLIPGVGNPLSFHEKGREYHGAHLDRDDIDWIGPETITIFTLKSGTYTYYVNNYNYRANKQALGNSDIRVKVYQGNTMIRDYRVPQGHGINYELFKIVNGRIQDTGRFDDSLLMH